MWAHNRRGLCQNPQHNPMCTHCVGRAFEHEARQRGPPVAHLLHKLLATRAKWHVSVDHEAFDILGVHGGVGARHPSAIYGHTDAKGCIAS